MSEHEHMIRIEPSARQLPILLSVPHAGRQYPQCLLDNLVVDSDKMLGLEDRYVDLLSRDARQDRVEVMIATIARAAIDLNRSPNDIDPAMLAEGEYCSFARPSARSHAGIGLFPRYLSRYGELWRQKMTVQQVEQSLADYHRPWHSEISSKLESIANQFGVALLLDLHSMPPLGQTKSGKPVANIVLGNLHGRSCPEALLRHSGHFLSNLGYQIGYNAPYAGGYTLGHHSDGANNIFALQLEIGRHLYLDAALREPVEARVKRLSSDIAALIDHCGEWLLSAGGMKLQAAE